MIIARLVDHEGVTVVSELALNDPPDQPRRYVYAAAARKFSMVQPSDAPYTPSFDTIEYELERRDGGGTYIYRRVTPLWR